MKKNNIFDQLKGFLDYQGTLYTQINDKTLQINLDTEVASVTMLVMHQENHIALLVPVLSKIDGSPHNLNVFYEYLLKENFSSELKYSLTPDKTLTLNTFMDIDVEPENNTERFVKKLTELKVFFRFQYPKLIDAVSDLDLKVAETPT